MRSHSRGLESDTILLDATSTPAEGVSGWEEHVGEGEVESAVLALLEVGQVTAAKQLQQKLAPTHVPLELLLVETAHRIAMLSQPTTKGAVVPAFLHPSVLESLASTNLLDDIGSATPMQARQPGSVNLYTKRLYSVVVNLLVEYLATASLHYVLT
jgi:hypothetical protein